MARAETQISRQRERRTRRRYGIGEWYGRSFTALTDQERKAFGDLALGLVKPVPKCPFRTWRGVESPCTKKGGVCSLRGYEQDGATNVVWALSDKDHTLVTVCPHRLKEDHKIYQWVGQMLLGTTSPLLVGEVGFLEGRRSRSRGGREDVGRIDNVLVHPSRLPLHWCALEIQAVYFSGSGMENEFKAITTRASVELPFPIANRRPDYRSSGPKRLMPQLQIKVPALRRWGKKMAVVVDRSFFGALEEMDAAPDISNCDVIWFIVTYEESGGTFSLKPDFTRFTTLEAAVNGLTGGHPVSLEEFESRVRAKLGGEYATA